MLCPLGVLRDLEGLAEQRFGLGVAPLASETDGAVIEVAGLSRRRAGLQELLGQRMLPAPAGQLAVLDDHRRQLFVANHALGIDAARVVEQHLKAHAALLQGLCPIGALDGFALLARRSEERRVGKECRSRWSPYH